MIPRRFVLLFALILGHALAFGIGCTHNPLPENQVRTDCGWENLADEAGWLFLNCRVKNEAPAPQSVAFKPELDPEDRNLREPTVEELGALQERLKKRSLMTAPFLGTGSSDRPEMFVMQALAGLSMLMVSNQAKIGPVSAEHKLELKPGEARTLLFPLKGRREEAPTEVVLRFKEPKEEVRKQPMEKDATDVRRRN